jgi:hypothetical protein
MPTPTFEPSDDIARHLYETVPVSFCDQLVP